MNMELSELERKALDSALSGDEQWKADLRRQCSHRRVVSRRYTGFGFFAGFICEGCSAVRNLPPADSPERARCVGRTSGCEQ
jgi:hypothetical protein